MFLQNLEEGNHEMKGVMISVGKNYKTPLKRAFAMYKITEDTPGFEEATEQSLLQNTEARQLIQSLNPIVKNDIDLSAPNSLHTELYKLLKQSIEESSSPPSWFFQIDDSK